MATDIRGRDSGGFRVQRVPVGQQVGVNENNPFDKRDVVGFGNDDEINRQRHYDDNSHSESSNTFDLINENRRGLLQIPTERLLHEPVGKLLGDGNGQYSDSNGNTLDASMKVHEIVEDNVRRFSDLQISDEHDGVYNHDGYDDGDDIPYINDLEHDPFFQQRQVHHILGKLFNAIQVFLIRNQMSLNFLKQFEKYIDYLVEFNMDPLEDECVLILQNELSVVNNFKFTNEIETVIKKFLINPDNLLMKLTYFKYNKNQIILNKYFSNMKIRMTCNKMQKIYEKFVKAKFLQKWKTEYESYVNDYWEKSILSDELSIKGVMFDKIFVKFLLIQRTKLVADNKFKQVSFKRITKRYVTLQENNEIFQKRKTDLLIKLYWKKWLLKHKLFNYRPNNLKIKEKIYEKFSNNFKRYQEYGEYSDHLGYILSTKPKLKIWKLRLDSYIKENDQLEELSNKFIKKKFISLLHNNISMKKREIMNVNHLNNMLLRYIIRQVWFKRFKERLHLYSLSDINNDHLKEKYMKCMQRKFYLQISADQFCRTELLQTVWKSWKFQTDAKNQIQKHNRSVIKYYFKQWERKLKLLRILDKHRKENVIKKKFTHWKVRKVKISKAGATADIFYEKLMKKSKFQKIIQYREKSIVLERIYLTFIKAKIMDKFKIKIERVKKLEYIGNTTSCEKLEILRKKGYFRKWNKKTINMKEEKLNWRLLMYENDRREKDLKKFMELFHAKFSIFYSEFSRLSDKIRYKHLKRMMFENVLIKFDNNYRDYENAENVYNENISRKFLTVWYYKYTEANILLQGIIDQKNLYLVSRYLKLWSMNHFKIIRNQKIVEDFRQRWDRATLRGLLQLWQSKLGDRNLDRNITESGRKENGVFSPLRNFNEPKTPRHHFNDDNDNGNNNSVTIPGSKEVRQYKVREMISHYGRARNGNRRRAIPSPLKESTALDSSIRKRMYSRVNNVAFKQVSPSPVKLDFGNVEPLKPGPPSLRGGSRKPPSAIRERAAGVEPESDLKPELYRTTTVATAEERRTLTQPRPSREPLLQRSAQRRALRHRSQSVLDGSPLRKTPPV